MAKTKPSSSDPQAQKKTTARVRKLKTSASSSSFDKDVMLLFHIVQSGTITPDWSVVSSKLNCSKTAAAKRFSRLKEKIERAEASNPVALSDTDIQGPEQISDEEIENMDNANLLEGRKVKLEYEEVGAIRFEDDYTNALEGNPNEEFNNMFADELLSEYHPAASDIN